MKGTQWRGPREGGVGAGDEGEARRARTEKDRVDRDEDEDEVLDEHADGGIENQGREK